MKRMITIVAAAAATLVLAACGSSNDNSSSSTPAAAGAKTVSVKKVDRVGSVLVDTSGMALYTPDQEADGKVRCAAGCLSFWKPLTAASGTPTAAGDAGKLSVIKRPDGTMQVAANGKPLYTFAEDSPGNLKGNGFKDAFNGQRFTWHAVLAGGKPAGSSSAGDGSGGGSSTGSNYAY